MAGAKRNGATTFNELSEVGQHLLNKCQRGSIFYELKIELGMYKMAHLEGKIVNHASREMLCLKGYILDDTKFPCQLLARTMHQSYLSIFKGNFR